jgi:hypothetical protein
MGSEIRVSAVTVRILRFEFGERVFAINSFGVKTENGFGE